MSKDLSNNELFKFSDSRYQLNDWAKDAICIGPLLGIEDHGQILRDKPLILSIVMIYLCCRRDDSLAATRKPQDAL
jgi:hypothetical protein